MHRFNGQPSIVTLVLSQVVASLALAQTDRNTIVTPPMPPVIVNGGSVQYGGYGEFRIQPPGFGAANNAPRGLTPVPAGPTMITGGAHVAFTNPAQPNRVWATTTAANQWDRYEVPENVTATVVLTGQTLALAVQGQGIDELAAFGSGNKWSVQKLDEPFDGILSPVVSTHLAIWVAGDTLYAFSSMTNQWDAVTLPTPGLVPAVTADMAYLQDGERFHLFTAKSGRWSVLDTAAAAAPKEAKPELKPVPTPAPQPNKPPADKPKPANENTKPKPTPHAK